MAILHSISNGNFTSSSTWGVIDATSYLDSRAASTTLTTSAVASSTFIPGAITISGVSIQVLGRIAIPLTSTITLQLFNSTSSTVITSVTINVSDLPNTGNQATPYAGWTYFKFSSNQTLVAGNSYSIRLLTSSGSLVSVYRDATANNWSRALVTTTNAAPAASDILITGGSYTSAGVSVTSTVTMDSTSLATQYGNIYVGSNGIFNYGVAASTNYALKLGGDLWIGRGGTFTIGTAAIPIPATSTAVLEINCASALQFQIYNFGTIETKYATTVLHRALLNADIAIGATTMTTDVSTGWKQNDVIVIPSTTRTPTQHERVTLSINASGTTLTHNATSFAHDGNAAIYIQADLANLTRSIKIRSTTGTFKTRFVQGLNGVTTFFDVEFFEMGGFIHNSGSILNAGTFNTQQCTFWQTTSPGTTTLFTYIFTTTYTLSNNVFYNYSDMFATVNDNNLIIGFTGFGAMGAGSLGSNNVITSCSAAGLSGVTLISGSSGNRFYATGGNGAIYFTGSVSSYTISNCVFFNNGTVITFNPNTSTTGSDRTVFERYENCYFYGNVTNFNGGSFRKLQFNNCFFWGGKTGLITAIGYTAISDDYMNFSNCTFGRRPDGVDSFFSTSCLRGGQAGTTLTNCLFYGTQATFAAATSFTSVNGFNGMTSLKHNGVTNEYRQYQSNGSIQNDSVIIYNGLPTIRITPTIATNKTFSNSTRVAVKSGAMCTISVAVRKSGVLDTLYNGNQPRLMYAFNPLAGNLTETVGSTIVNNNLILAPENFGLSPWLGANTVLTLNSTTAPNGNENADTIIANSNSAFRSYPLAKATSSITYTGSIYAKKGTNDWILFQLDDGTNFAGFWFNLNTGVAGNTRISSPFTLNSYSSVSVGNDWYLLTINVTSSTTAQIQTSIAVTNANNALTSTIGNTIFAWGAQLVVGGAQAYVPEGLWNTLTYTTPAVSNDCILEFYIDCDGTTGWININDFKTTTSNDTRGMGYWSTVGVYVEPDWRRPGGTYTFCG